MTTRSRRQIASSTPGESYNAAVQLYNQEIRTLSERTYAFLIGQSILVIAFVTTLVNSKLFPYVLVFIMWVIIMAGVVFIISYHVAGKLGSLAALRWRRYMLHIENNNPDAPWSWFYRNCKSGLEKQLLKKPLLLILWLITPGIFAGIWSFFSAYIARRLFIKGDPLTVNLGDFFPPCLAQAISIIVALIAFGVLCYLIYCFAKLWFRHTTEPES